jgi:hypothetical protein
MAPACCPAPYRRTGLPSAPHVKARRSQGTEIRELAGRAGLKGARLARACSSAAYGMTAAVRRLQVSGHELKGDGGLAYG